MKSILKRFMVVMFVLLIISIEWIKYAIICCGMLEIFQYDFMVRAFIVGIALAVITPMVGIFLVVRRYSLMPDTLAHVALLGIVIGYFFDFSPLLSAIIISVSVAVGIEKLRQKEGFSGDALLSMVLSGSLAISLVLMGFLKGSGMNFFGFLFGSITTVSINDVYIIVFLLCFSGVLIGVFYKELFLISYDEELATVQGMKVSRYNFLMMFLVAVVVSLALKIVGALLVGALMVIPVMVAIRFKNGFLKTLFIAVAFSMFSVILGLFISYYAGWPSGGTIVLIALGLFLSSLLLNKR